MNMQAKLLRAIEGGGYSPVGSSFTKKSDFRIIAATNRNLLDMSKKGVLREDFFYRIHIIPIDLPPLRSRKDDVPLLVEHFLRLYSTDRKVPAISGQVLEALMNYDWPGNVRELQNVLQRYLTVKRIDFLTPASRDIPKRGSDASNDTGNAARTPNLQENMDGLEKALIKEALEKYRWNKSRVAEELLISRKTLARKMKRLGL
jgi:transcriptional regulator with PAS, ATPase and Fis domain